MEDYNSPDATAGVLDADAIDAFDDVGVAEGGRGRWSREVCVWGGVGEGGRQILEWGPCNFLLQTCRHEPKTL